MITGSSAIEIQSKDLEKSIVNLQEKLSKYLLTLTFVLIDEKLFHIADRNISVDCE